MRSTPLVLRLPTLYRAHDVGRRGKKKLDLIRERKERMKYR